MSELETGNIRKLLSIEQENEEILKQEIQEKQEALLRCQGKILAFEELLKNSDDVFDSVSVEGVAGVSENKSSGLKSTKKERAPRTTKKEMERRREMVRKVFSVHGDLSAKELQPLVEELLGYEMEPHHLRAVLRKFSDDFIQRDDHGIWGLTDDLKNQSGLLSEGDSVEDSSDEISETE